MLDRRLSATAIQGKKDSGLEQCRVFRINHTVHGNFEMAQLHMYSLHALETKNDGPTEALTLF